ncbi:regulatory factor X-associated protein-like [Tubulanus polymorphus]|uniref:regulatory factor X-associated protein-like n=1 Tax=Tubulanus polymorphus TaxID=672921 RepID=UPI003DA40193
MEMVNIQDFFDESLHHQGALREIHMNEGQDMKDSMTYIRPISDKEVTSSTEKSSPAGRKLRMQKCSVDGCKEITYKTRTSRSWVCRQHQSKLQKEMLKKRLEERCRTPITELQKSTPAAVGSVPVSDKVVLPCSSGGNAPEPGHAGALLNSLRPSLLEEVLNEKKLGLMRSPEVMRFLRREQKNVEIKRRQEVANDRPRSAEDKIHHR